MKSPLPPAEVHRQYEETLCAFIQSLPDAVVRARLVREADDFFRACALGVWNADGGSLTAGYVEYYNALYLRGNPPASILFWELSRAVAGYAAFQPPACFVRMRSYDKVAGSQISRRFVDVFTLIALLLASVDGVVSEREARFVNRCADVLSALCDKDALPGGKPPLNARDFVTTMPAAAQPDLAQQQVPSQHSAPPEPSLEELLARLDGLCGLEKVKSDVKSLINLMKVRKLRRQEGLPVPPLSLHLVFMGNPGTGKTTVARLLAQLYHAIGVLSKGQLVEVDRSGLVAGFVGQTALKTQQAVDRALGGVLFIDEAYALTSHTGQNDFGQEAVEVLLKNMEDHREDLVVIVAGYTGLMSEFIHSNPGLESRFNKYFIFEDYTGGQMLDIFRSMCGANGYTLSDEADACAREYLQELYDSRDENFGNARDVRNFFERAAARQADRLAGQDAPGKDALMALEAADLRAAGARGGI